MKIYVCGGSSELDAVSARMQQLREMGHTITHDWTANVRSVGDANPRTVTHKQRSQWAADDLRGIEEASLVWVMLPIKRSRRRHDGHYLWRLAGDHLLEPSRRAIQRARSRARMDQAIRHPRRMGTRDVRTGGRVVSKGALACAQGKTKRLKGSGLWDRMRRATTRTRRARPRSGTTPMRTMTERCRQVGHATILCSTEGRRKDDRPISCARRNESNDSRSRYPESVRAESHPARASVDYANVVRRHSFWGALALQPEA
jgi:hypothetical protein